MFLFIYLLIFITYETKIEIDNKFMLKGDLNIIKEIENSNKNKDEISNITNKIKDEISD